MTHPLLILLLAAAPAVPAAQDAGEAETTQPAEDAEAKSRAAVEAALVELRAELASTESPEMLSKKAEYFDKGAAKKQRDDVLPSTVLEALRSRLHPAPAADAYLKLQLLSAVQGRFPDELAGDALALYRQAAPPLPRPGLTDRDRQVLARNLQGKPAGMADQLDQEFKAYAEQQTLGNDQILAYRDELYARLPISGPTLEAGLRDAYARVNAGIASHDLLRTVIGDAKSWASGGAPRDDVMVVARLMMDLNGYEPPQYINGVEADGTGLDFDDRRAWMGDQDALRDAAIELDQLSRNDGGTLRIR